MRLTRIALLTVLPLAGCGSGSSAPDNSAAGVELSIKSPAATSAVTGKDVAATPGQYTETVRQLIQKANSAVVAGRNNVAIESLSQAIGVSPDDASLFRMRADVYSLQGENANARADFSTAIRLNPENADLYNYRGYFLMNQGLTNDARSDFNRAAVLNPRHAAALNNRGLLSLAEQNYKAAEADFSLAIDADRKLADAWNNRAFARFKMEQSATALADVKEALRLKEDYITAWNNRGLIEMQMQNFDDAEKSFARAVQLDPMDVRWVNHHRSALIRQNRFAEAQDDAKKIEWLTQLTTLSQQATRNARDPRVWISRGRHLMNGSQYGAAIQDFTRALIVNPGNPEALFDRAVAWVRTGDFQKAMLDCDESLVSRPTREAYSLRGDLWMQLENPDQALSDYESAGRIDEDVVAAYEKRAALKRAAGDTAEADADLIRAKELREALADKPASGAQTPRTADGFSP